MADTVAPASTVTVTVDGTSVEVPQGTMLIRATELAGVAVPRFCDHPLLDPVGACRQCLVEITDAGNGRGFPKPQPSCTTAVANGMVVKTQATSQPAHQAQAEILELLLINHPLDCPICDKGGECPLQNQAMSEGRGETRFDGVKRTYPKPVRLSPQILLDRERCVLCARCTRFADQIAGDPDIALTERGAKQQVAIYPDRPFDSYFSGNVVQICPVGALTSVDYHFSARPFDLVSTVTTCENCAAGCQLRVDQRHGSVRRRLAGNDPAVNEEWSCDKGRFGFWSRRGDERVTRPLVRKNGELVEASWPEAIAAAVEGLQRPAGEIGVLTGGRLTLETAYAYSRFARAVLGTNSIDHRARALSAEEEGFLGAHVAGRTLGDSVTYAELETAKRVVLVGFEPEDEAPIVFLRLRKAVRKNHLAIATFAPYLSRGGRKLKAHLVPTAPGQEALMLAAAAKQFDATTIVLVGERLAGVPGALTQLVAVTQATGARWAWVPRRAGEVGAIEAGCLPSLLPGGRPAADAAARDEVGQAWGATLPAAHGLDALEQIAAAERSDITAFVVAGVEAADFLDSATATAAFERAFVVSLETRRSDVAALADVVLPVQPFEEVAGTFLDWEHRERPVVPVVRQSSGALSEIRLLAALARGLGHDLGFTTAREARASFDGLGAWSGAKATMDPVDPVAPAKGLTLATWRELIDDSRSVDGEDALIATARPAVARISAATAADHGLDGHDAVEIAGRHGSVTLPLVIDDSMAPRVIWAPQRSRGRNLAEAGLTAGDVVRVSAADLKGAVDPPGSSSRPAAGAVVEPGDGGADSNMWPAADESKPASGATPGRNPAVGKDGDR